MQGSGVCSCMFILDLEVSGERLLSGTDHGQGHVYIVVQVSTTTDAVMHQTFPDTLEISTLSAVYTQSPLPALIFKHQRRTDQLASCVCAGHSYLRLNDAGWTPFACSVF